MHTEAEKLTLVLTACFCKWLSLQTMTTFIYRDLLMTVYTPNPPRRHESDMRTTFLSHVRCNLLFGFLYTVERTVSLSVLTDSQQDDRKDFVEILLTVNLLFSSQVMRRTHISPVCGHCAWYTPSAFFSTIRITWDAWKESFILLRVYEAVAN